MNDKILESGFRQSTLDKAENVRLRLLKGKGIADIQYLKKDQPAIRLILDTRYDLADVLKGNLDISTKEEAIKKLLYLEPVLAHFSVVILENYRPEIYDTKECNHIKIKNRLADRSCHLEHRRKGINMGLCNLVMVGRSSNDKAAKTATGTSVVPYQDWQKKIHEVTQGTNLNPGDIIDTSIQKSTSPKAYKGVKRVLSDKHEFIWDTPNRIDTYYNKNTTLLSFQTNFETMYAHGLKTGEASNLCPLKNIAY